MLSDESIVLITAFMIHTHFIVTHFRDFVVVFMEAWPVNFFFEFLQIRMIDI